MNDYSGWIGPGDLFERATRFAAFAHAGQLRKWTKEPYILHPWRVACSLREMGAPHLVPIAALLHDVVEDCGVPIGAIRLHFQDTIADFVDHCTDQFTKENYPSINRARRKVMELERLREIPVGVIGIKCADFLDNWASINACDPGFAKVFRNEKMAAIPIMREVLHWHQKRDPDVWGGYADLIDRSEMAMAGETRR